VTDGPYTEASEVLGGYFLIERRITQKRAQIARTRPHLTGSHRQIEEVYLGDGSILSRHCDEIHELVEHLFRREAGRIASRLTRIFGTHRLALIEDCCAARHAAGTTAMAL